MIGPHAQKGLTLVELLLGLAITAVLMVPLAAMFQTASGSSIATQAALDLNADARFALERIAQRAAAAPSVSSGVDVTGAGANAWLAPRSYAVTNTDLVETDTTTKPARSNVIASNVSAFKLSAPDVGDGQALLRIDLTLTVAGSSVSASRIVRVGAPF